MPRKGLIMPPHTFTHSFTHLFTLLLVEVAVRTNDHQFDRSSNIFWVEHLGKNIKYCYATDLRRCGDGFVVPRAKRSAFFCLNLKMKDPESIAGKIMVNIK
jgi:hypothetical protein